MKVPLLDLKQQNEPLTEQLEEAFRRVLHSGQYILGKEVEAFEQEYATYCQSKYCIGVANGLEALHLILRAYGIGKGHEVREISNALGVSPKTVETHRTNIKEKLKLKNARQVARMAVQWLGQHPT